MKRFQFSLSGIFALMLVVGVLATFVGRFESEAFLLAIWLTTFFLSYWKSPQRGWGKIFQITVITAAVWAVCIFGTHLMYANVPGTENLILRAGFLVLIGAAAAFLTASVLQGVGAAVRRWLKATTRGRILSMAALVTVVFSGRTVWNAERSGYWEPVAVASGEMPSLEPETVRRIRDRHQGKIDRISISPDGSFLATIRAGKEILVFDLITGNLAASFEVQKNKWYTSITFLPDNSLAAMQLSRNGDWKRSLVRWDTTDWTSPAPVPVTDLFDASRPGKSYAILVDHILLVIYVDDRQAAATQVEIKTVDLLEKSWLPKEFSSATIGPSDVNPRVMNWTVSPNGQWIVSGKWGFGRRAEWVFGRGARESLRLSGHFLGFLPDGDHVVRSEGTGRFVWQLFPRSPVVEPPFWNHLGMAHMTRVSIFDCRTNRFVMRSRWWRGPVSNTSFDGSRLLVNRRNSSLLWEVPRIAQ